MKIVFITIIIFLSLFELKSNPNEIPPDGEYIYQIRFAEWENRYHGQDVKVVIKGDSIKVFHHKGELSNIKIGELFEEGIIKFHEESGNWIIIKNEEDMDTEEVGGCSDGPTIINFEEKYYLLC